MILLILYYHIENKIKLKKLKYLIYVNKRKLAITPRFENKSVVGQGECSYLYLLKMVEGQIRRQVGR